jgi:hypothetical protein
LRDVLNNRINILKSNLIYYKNITTHIFYWVVGSAGSTTSFVGSATGGGVGSATGGGVGSATGVGALAGATVYPSLFATYLYKYESSLDQAL